MGRKVHPIGFRLKINKTWDSRWFAAPDKYADQLHEDREIRELILKTTPRAGISKIEIERFPNSVQIIVHTARPGIVIGRKGANVKELRRMVQELTGTTVKLDISEIKEPDLDARLVAENIASQLERRISHRRAMQRAVAQTMRQGAEGIKVMCSGRLGGKEMARREWMREGRVPAQTLRADIDFARSEALTTFGRIGVKVWIYKGEILLEAVEELEAVDVYVSG
ncbi:MAG: 30S ribosomal protein S3 [Anaerolineales bacterium]|jgi:small subunit ribosomal protein S3|nr:30S ribosomal protein S3 [Anaerolineales bacterium]HUS84673.1 30S ribosomal protein S3 [Anaerolineales bacterium]